MILRVLWNGHAWVLPRLRHLERLPDLLRIISWKLTFRGFLFCLSPLKLLYTSQIVGGQNAKFGRQLDGDHGE